VANCKKANCKKTITDDVAVIETQPGIPMLEALYGETYDAWGSVVPS
jgi:hypothetical protein